jgi:Uma2 family endonuclease
LGQSIEVYRRQNTDLDLFFATLIIGDLIESPLLPGFSKQVDAVFAGISSGSRRKQSPLEI